MGMKELIRCGRALESATVLQACRSTIDKELAKFNQPPIDCMELTTQWQDKGLAIAVSNYNCQEYDIIMDNKNTYIANTKKITCVYTIEQVLIDYGISIMIKFIFECALPEEDLSILYMLGKIKTEHYTSHDIEQRVICNV